MRRKPILVALLLAALVGTACSKEEKVAATGAPIATAAAGGSSPQPAVGTNTPGLQGATQTVPDFATVVEQNKGAVVNITSTMRRSAAQPQMQNPFGGGGRDEDDEDNPLNQFFRRFQQPMPQMPPQLPQQGMGSGFIIDPNGAVLTNAHLVEGADEVRVKLPDKREFKGKVAGIDHLTDVAVVKIDAKGLPAGNVGGPSQTRRGRGVLAIGPPLGLPQPAPAGHITAPA